MKIGSTAPGISPWASVKVHSTTHAKAEALRLALMTGSANLPASLSARRLEAFAGLGHLYAIAIDSLADASGFKVPKPESKAASKKFSGGGGTIPKEKKSAKRGAR